MNRSPIEFDHLNINIFRAWNEAFLLTAGDFERGRFNTMTIAWGSLGVMWSRPFVQVVVRPTRYTYGFIEEFETFTVSGFSRNYKKALGILGSKSGRDGDKLKESGLTPASSTVVKAPSFVEADLSIECRKIYFHDFLPENFLAGDIGTLYNNDYHRCYYGEIAAITGTPNFEKK